MDKFEKEINKLQSFLQKFPPYECKDFQAVKTELDEMAAQKENLEEEKRKLEEDARKANVEMNHDVETVGLPNKSGSHSGIVITNELTSVIDSYFSSSKVQ